MFSNLYYIYKTTYDICDMTDVWGLPSENFGNC